MLTHRGIDAWIEDLEGNEFVDRTSAEVNDNEIATRVGMSFHQRYRVCWRKSADSGPHHAWCEVYRISVTGQVHRGAAAYMDRTDHETQERRSDDFLDERYPQGFIANCNRPKSKPNDDGKYDKFGEVSLVVHRAKGPIKAQRLSGSTVSRGISITLRDDEPWVVFKFELKIRTCRDDFRTPPNDAIHILRTSKLRPKPGARTRVHTVPEPRFTQRLSLTEKSQRATSPVSNAVDRGDSNKILYGNSINDSVDSDNSDNSDDSDDSDEEEVKVYSENKRRAHIQYGSTATDQKRKLRGQTADLHHAAGTSANGTDRKIEDHRPAKRPKVEEATALLPDTQVNARETSRVMSKTSTDKLKALKEAKKINRDLNKRLDERLRAIEADNARILQMLSD